MADHLAKKLPQKPWERFPIPTNLTLCLLVLGVGLAALLNWKVVLGLDLAILVLSVLDYTLTFKDGEIQGKRICPRHFTVYKYF